MVFACLPAPRRCGMLRKICGQKWSRGWILAVFVAGVTGCIQDPPDSSGTGHAGSLSQAAHINPGLSMLATQIKDSIEIDQLNGGPGDTNLFTGPDPADGTASAQL